MISITTKQLSDQLGINYVEAAGLMKVLVRNGQAEQVARVYHKSGTGKPSRIYRVSNKVTIKIPKIKPEPKYLIVDGRLTQTTDSRTMYKPKPKPKAKVAKPKFKKVV